MGAGRDRVATEERPRADHRLGASGGPTRARAFEARVEHALAAAFDDTAAHGQVLGAEGAVA